jgi:hypothetical protein
MILIRFEYTNMKYYYNESLKNNKRRIICCISLIFTILTILMLSCNSEKSEEADEDILKETTIPSYAIKGIKESLGFVLTPIYLPKDTEFSRYSIQEVPGLQHNPLVTLAYGNEEQVITFIYCTEWPPDIWSAPDGLAVPEDAIKEISINGQEAYVIRGTWPHEMWQERSETGSVDLETEWEYESLLSVRFAIDIPYNDPAGVFLGVGPFDPNRIDEDQLIKIAESVEVIE